MLDAIGQAWNTAGFWCILALFWAAEHIARMETREETIEDMQSLRKHIEKRLEQLIKLEAKHKENDNG